VKKSPVFLIFIFVLMLLSTALATPGIETAPQHTPAVWPPSVAELEKRLGWVHHSSPTEMCSGYYLDLPSQFPPDLSKDNIYLRADKAVLSQTKPSVYTGHVVVAQKDAEMTADRAVTELNSEKSALKNIKVFGDVHLRQPGIVVVADKAEVVLPEQQSTLTNLVYRLLRDPQPQSAPNKNFAPGITGRGIADTFKKVAPNQYELTESRYTTCAPDDHSWVTTAKTMHIDSLKKRIIAKHAYFSVAGVPIFYTPYLNFSYDNTPKSGFLIPGVQTSSLGGTQFEFPFYWYAAPNTTLLFTPSYWLKRGNEFSFDFNYLTWNSKGQFYFNVLPDDPVFANFQATTNSPAGVGLNRLKAAPTARTYLSWQQQTILNPYWSAKAAINYVSDDYYFQDFGSNSLSQYSLNQLPQQGSLEYHGPHWNFLGSLQNYQTLHPVNTGGVPDQYARTPQLSLNGSFPKIWQRFTFSPQFDFVNFTQPWLTNQQAIGQPGFPITGQRLNIAPALSLPLRRPGGYLTPQIQIQNTQYSLVGVQNGAPASINRVLPVFSIDSGLYFDRGFQFGGDSYTQTLEPRLFYLYVPTVDQSNIPLFDTSVSTFTYNSVFQTNRFTGIDRMSNANQIGVGFTSRLIDDNTGFNRLTANIGQIYYFANREVPLSYNVPSSPNNSLPISPIAGELSYFVNKAVTISGNAAWNPHYNFWQNGIVNLAYRPDPVHIFNIGASYQRMDAADPGVIPYQPGNNIKQLVGSAYWPLSLKWSGMTALTYNLQKQYAMNSLIGLEYNTCCWAFRAVASSNFISAKQDGSLLYNNVYYIQFLFRGFTNVGINNGINLATSIPGFVDKIQVQ
jgi:LPS-assembly protein